jgi:hypothetical protein
MCPLYLSVLSRDLIQSHKVNVVWLIKKAGPLILEMIQQSFLSRG